MKSDWLPRNHEALYDKAKQTATYIRASENCERMGFSPDSRQGKWFETVFMPAFVVFISVFEVWQNAATRTSVATAALREAQKVFSGIFRKLYMGFLKNNPLVSDTDRIAMGLPEGAPDKRTPPPIPDGIPESEVRLPAPGVIAIHFRNAGATDKAKPAGVHGAEIVWAVLETPPTDWAELTRSEFSTNSPLTLVFSGEKRGKHLYFALRWRNTRGERGNWSAIQMAIIP